jgi:hypothetical protein
MAIPQRKQVQECGQGDPDLLEKKNKHVCESMLWNEPREWARLTLTDTGGKSDSI